ncbi:MAG: alpha/beta hydrolase [Thermoplasmata archaeon]|nr:alpha/beta hydrolase [Candidatus Sysuiplasma acidicola]MBX8646804.1 alpha/beta hydrolase [Candidatus Sysuiplasma acidicola]
MSIKLTLHDGRNSLTAILKTVSKKDVFIVCHGLAGRADDPIASITSKELERMGHSTFRLSHRTGTRNELLFEEQVRQIVESVTLLKCHYLFRRIHLLGLSMGASNAIIAGSMDARVVSVCAVSGISDGETWMRERHGSQYSRFTAMLCGRENTEYRTGRLRSLSIIDVLAPDSRHRRIIKAASMKDRTRPDSLSARSVRSLLMHNPLNHIGSLAGRPLFIAHGLSDSLVSVENSRRLYASASEPKKLMLYDGMDHDMMLHESARRSVLSEYIGFLSEMS